MLYEVVVDPQAAVLSALGGHNMLYEDMLYEC